MTTQTNPLDQAFLYNTLESSIEAALEVYANVHRGSGQHSIASTRLYEQARDQMLAYWGLNTKDYTVIFGSPYRINSLIVQYKPVDYHLLRSSDFGLPLGLWAFGIKRKDLPRGVPDKTGGGTVLLVSSKHVIWAAAPERFEAGTPAVINTLAFVRALTLANRWDVSGPEIPVDELFYKDEFIGLHGDKLLKALRSSLLGKTRLAPTIDGFFPHINLDNAASTPTFAPIWQTVRQVWRQPKTMHQSVIAEVKNIIARFLNAPASRYKIIFTANTTEAINLAAYGLTAKTDIEPVVLNTLMEHHSNDLPWRYIPRSSVLRLPVDNKGLIDHAAIEAQLIAYNAEHKFGHKRITWIAVTGLSNVLGTCNDLKTLARLAHKYDARLLADGAQLVAHRPINLMDSEIDAFVFSGHKVYAPFGSGALVLKDNLLQLPENELNEIYKSGEENVIGIAALGKSLSLLERIGMPVIEATERELTRSLLDGLAKFPEIKVFGINNSDDPDFKSRGAVVAFRVQKIPHNLVAQELAEFGGIDVRSGCFCSHLIVKKLMHIHPLRSLAADFAIMLAPKFVSSLLPGIVRISLGLENEASDITKCLQTLQKITNTSRSWLERMLGSIYNGTPFLPQTATGKLMEDFVIAVTERVYSNNKIIKDQKNVEKN